MADAAPADPQHLAEAVGRAMFDRDRASQMLGLTLDSIAPGRAAMTMRVRPDMCNGHAICHGGFIFTLADSAFAYACNSYNLVTVASGCSIDFLAPKANKRARQVLRDFSIGGNVAVIYSSVRVTPCVLPGHEKDGYTVDPD